MPLSLLLRITDRWPTPLFLFPVSRLNHDKEDLPADDDEQRGQAAHRWSR